MLLAQARMPLERVLALPATCGLVREIRVPDGTISGPLLASGPGQLRALLVTSDKAIRVRVGLVSQNTDIPLAPGGVLVFVGTETPAFFPVTVTYTPGDGSVATVAVLVGVEQPPQVRWSEPWEAVITYHPAWQWTEPWEAEG